MSVLKTVRNILGTVTMILAGYVLIESLTDARRYIRISSM
jgi:uncharacterized protein DUF6893